MLHSVKYFIILDGIPVASDELAPSIVWLLWILDTSLIRKANLPHGWMTGQKFHHSSKQNHPLYTPTETFLINN